MEKVIRKIVEAAKQSLRAGCPILAVPLFLRQGWETTKASHALVLAGCPFCSARHRSTPG